ncbi:MAG: hypothetical protein N2C14_29715, partial [Planctomycetales bacterium]
VGQLLVHSENPWIALSLGWHPWSLCRGIGFLVITYEVVGFSLERFTGQTLSTRPRRLGRWSAGLLLVLADGVIKYNAMEAVRQTLASNLS